MSGNQGLFEIKNEIGIINLALSQLSIDPIPSLNDSEDKRVNEMRRDFQIAKENILRSYVFDWAHKSEKLILYPDEKGGYQKPSDYINFIGLGTAENFCCCSSLWKNLNSYSHDSSVRYVNGRLYIERKCCCEPYEYFHYSYNNQNYADMQSDLLQAIALELSYISGMRLTKDQGLVEYTRQRRDDILSMARKHAGFENKQSNRSNFYDIPSIPVYPTFRTPGRGGYW